MRKKNMEEAGKKKNNRVYGITAALLTALFFQLGNVGLRYTYLHNPKIPLALDALLVRGAIQTIITSIDMLVNCVHPLERLKDLPSLLIAGFAKSGADLTFKLALMFVPLSTTSTIYALAPFVTMCLAYIFLKERIKYFEAFFGVVCFAGIVLVIRSSEPAERSSKTSYIEGILLIFLCLFLASVFSVWTKKNTSETRYQLSIFYPSVTMVALYGMAAPMSHTPIQILKLETSYILILLSCGVFYYFAMLCEVLSLRYERAGLVTLLKNTEFVWAYAFDMTINHVMPTPMGIVGVVIVVIASLLIGLNGLYNLDQLIVKSCCGKQLIVDESESELLNNGVDSDSDSSV